jgi:hypothetical protein
MTAPVAAPPSVRVATGTLLALAVLLVASAALTLVGQEAVVDRFVAAQPGLDRAATTRALVLGQVLYLVLGLAAGVGGVALLRRRPWGRWLGLAAALFLGLRTVLSAVGAGGTTVFSLLVLVLCIAAVTSLLARTTRTWLPGPVEREG